MKTANNMTKQEQLAELRRELYYFDASAYITEYDYRDMLNECYGQVEICGYKYDAGCALNTVDPIAFRCGYADYTANYNLDSIEAYRELKTAIEALEYELGEMDA